MPKQKTADVLVDVAVSLKNLTEEIKGIGDRVAKLEQTKESTTQVVEPSVGGVEDPSVKVPEGNIVENPLHRNLVSEVLNKHFNFRIESEFSGTRLVILVPKKYSNASDSHWETYGGDERPSKPFAAHEVEPMFRVHVEAVFNNFNPDTKALIVNDR